MKRHSRKRRARNSFDVLNLFSGRRGTGMDFSPPRQKRGGFSLFDMPKSGGFNSGMSGVLLDPMAPNMPRRIRRKKLESHGYQKSRYGPRERHRQKYREPEGHHEKKGVDWKGLASEVVSGTRRIGMAAKARVESVNQNTKNYNALRSKYASGGWKALSDSEKKSITEGAAKRGESI
jgi:hypothetical protein